MRTPTPEPLRSFSTRGRRFTDTLSNAVRNLPATHILWEVTTDGFVPVAHRHPLSLSLNHDRLSSKDIARCYS